MLNLIEWGSTTLLMPSFSWHLLCFAMEHQQLHYQVSTISIISSFSIVTTGVGLLFPPMHASLLVIYPKWGSYTACQEVHKELGSHQWIMINMRMLCSRLPKKLMIKFFLVWQEQTVIDVWIFAVWYPQF